METYSNNFKDVIKSLESEQFRTVHLGDKVESVRAKEAENELFEGNVYMPYIGYFIKLSTASKQWYKVLYMYENDLIDHIRLSFDHQQHDTLGISLQEFSLIGDDFITFFNQTYGEIVEKGKNSLGNKGRETYQLWHSKDEKCPLSITLVTHFKPKEKEATYLQITFAKLV